VIIPASCFTPDPAQGYELAAVASPGATGVTFESTHFGSVFPIGRATQDLSGTWVLDVPATTPFCLIVCIPETIPSSIQSVATYTGGVGVTSPAVDVNVVLYRSFP
jgi:hypothetical protein